MAEYLAAKAGAVHRDARAQAQRVHIAFQALAVLVLTAAVGAAMLGVMSLPAVRSLDAGKAAAKAGESESLHPRLIQHHHRKEGT